jgi:hypothetical protein
MLEPDREQIEIFVDAVFRHVDLGQGFVSLRSFVEGSNRVFRRPAVPTSASKFFQFLCDTAEDEARRAANEPKPAVFCPPLALFNNHDYAREVDLVAGLTLSVECDQHPQEARAKLESILGPATVVVASGGTWSDGNGSAQDKLHLHWRLTDPARGRKLAVLKRARLIATHLAGADTSNVPICHCIRWPGSWHCKAAPRLCTIVALDPDREITLLAAVRALKPHAGFLRSRTGGNGGARGGAPGGRGTRSPPTSLPATSCIFRSPGWR